MGDDMGGIAVHIGARIAGLAASGEVLVSSTVKDLVNGSGIAFQDRGTHVLKGVRGEWRLYAPAGQDDPIGNLRPAPEKAAQDRVADYLTRWPAIGRTLLLMAERRQSKRTGTSGPAVRA